MKRTKRITSITLVFAMLLGMTLVTGCTNKYIKPSTAKKTLAVTIGEDKINMDKLVPLIFLTEITYDCQGEYYSVMYSQYGYSFGDVWNDKNDDGVKGSESVRDEAMENYIRMYIISKAAEEAGSETANITDELVDKFKDNAKELIKCMSKKMLKKTGLTEDDFVEFQKMTFKYMNFMDEKKAEFAVTKADVEADVDYDNVYRQYNSNYVRYPIATQKEDGSSVAIDDEAKAAALETMNKALSDLKGGKNIDQVVADYEGIEAATDTYTYTQESAYPLNVPKEDKEEDADAKESEDKDDDSKDSEEEEVKDTTDEYMLKTRELQNGEYSEVFEYNNYYYIALMEDNNSKEAYDKQIDTAITELETQKFDDYYEDLKLQKAYEPKINKDVWNTLEFGELTIEHDEVAKFYGTLK